jgi:SAM-dependent MidA family methyltransferase
VIVGVNSQNVQHSSLSLQRFEFCLSPRSTKAALSILPRRLAALPNRDVIIELEVGAEAMAVAEAIALRIHSDDGFALLVDYGQNSPYETSLNAIRDHSAVHPLQVHPLNLSSPGTTDLCVK